MAGAPAGGTDGLYSEQRECEERVFSLPRSHAAPLTASVRYRQEELREKSPLGRTSFQCGFQGRLPGPGDDSVIIENVLTEYHSECLLRYC